MIKLLLLTDTHGNLKIINDLVRKTGCDVVVHAGDFGFYDNESVARLSDREIWLFLKHAAIDQELKSTLLDSSADERRENVRELLPLSDLPLFLSGEEKFGVPVYVVWGNHEDVDVVGKFRNGAYAIKNLHLLDEKSSFHFGNCHLFGLGGNFLVGRKLFQRALAGGSGKVWSVLSEYEQLMATVKENAQPDEHRIFVTHVSPGKEPFMSLLGAHLKSNFNVSGHMGAPFTSSWTEFGLRSQGEAIGRMEKSCHDILGVLEDSTEMNVDRQRSFIQGLLNLPEESVHRGREFSPEWYVNMWHVNLPDVVDGYAVLEINGDEHNLTTYPSA